MPNIEIKAICGDLELARGVAQKLGASNEMRLHQIDTYYTTKNGRLKLREINGIEGQLIPYYKDYSLGPMKSTYSLLPVSDITQTKEVLAHTLGVVAIVDKTRDVLLLDNIRIHLDQVKDLGEFIEFEAVYACESERENEIKKVNELIETFKIKKSELLDKSYIDYLIEKTKA
jgi:adenylate cyclase class IV